MNKKYVSLNRYNDSIWWKILLLVLNMKQNYNKCTNQ